MSDYKTMYYHLFNAVTDALEQIDERDTTAEILRQAQCECEEIYISNNKKAEP